MEIYYETSFRFKWGVGFMIELLNESLRQLNSESEEANFQLHYELEQQPYDYSFAARNFIEGQQLSQYSTATNFVLLVKDRSYFDQLVTIGNQLPEFKEQMINEWQDTSELGERYRQLYEGMANFDAILTYTELSLQWLDDHTLLVADPHPQEVNEHQHYSG